MLAFFNQKFDIVTCFMFDVVYFNFCVQEMGLEMPPGDYDCLMNKTIPNIKQDPFSLYMNSLVNFKFIYIRVNN